MSLIDLFDQSGDKDNAIFTKIIKSINEFHKIHGYQLNIFWLSLTRETK